MGTTIHSEQGVQFASWAFTRRTKESSLVRSMGSVGDCPAPRPTSCSAYDNSMIELLWSRMQAKLLNRRKWKTRLELANASSATSRSGTTDSADTANSECSRLLSASATTPSPWHENPGSRLHRIRCRPEPPSDPAHDTWAEASPVQMRANNCTARSETASGVNP